MKRLLFGFSIFTLIFFLIIFIIIFSTSSSIEGSLPWQELISEKLFWKDIFVGFLNINDFITSFLIVFGFSLAFVIYLSNQNIISNRGLIKVVSKIPDFVPFKHSLKNYFSKLIKKDFKIIVLIRSLDERNHEWVLNQIAAYNNIMGNPSMSFDKTSIEFLFVKKYTQDIRTLILQLNLAHHDYIILSGLSAIFKDAIMAREELSEEEQECIQIIGALSSIHDEQIQKIIDTDDKIIRIFPPDYDEAKTAINFLFSKIKNSICPDENCYLHAEKHNIIIVHNGTYGRAIRDKSKLYFDKEFLNLNISTSNKISAVELNNAINLYSYDYQHDGQLICDDTNADTFGSLLPSWEGANNHFYIIGYEPNISFILNHLDRAFPASLKLNFSLLFAGTASMHTWRKKIKETLLTTSHLHNAFPNDVYYLQLHTIENINTIQSSQSLDLKLKHYNPRGDNFEANIIEELTTLFPKKEVAEHRNLLDAYLKNENNYITTFTSDSLRIALFAIRHTTTLLDSKFKILRKDGRETDILVNGDSINQYTVKMLE